jgi:hypothetical protein
VLVPVSAHGSASERNCAVAGREVVEHLEKLAAIVVRACHLLAVNLGAARTA